MIDIKMYLWDFTSDEYSIMFPLYNEYLLSNKEGKVYWEYQYQTEDPESGIPILGPDFLRFIYDIFPIWCYKHPTYSNIITTVLSVIAVLLILFTAPIIYLIMFIYEIARKITHQISQFKNYFRRNNPQ